jgi:glucoamylase
MRFLHFFFALGLICSNATAASLRLPVNQWIDQQSDFSKQTLLQNISPSDGTPGSVIASPERVLPNYYFHWTRDSALAYLTVLHLYQKSNGSERSALKQKMIEFADFSARLQNADLGEPKFYLDGRPFDGAWCRPQSDGAALRAITLLQFALVLSGDDGATVKKHFFPVIKKDIDYVKNNWRKPSCDLWEEVYGDHFYTRMVQRRSLIDGAAVAKTLGEDPQALLAEAKAIEQELLKHWDDTRGYFVATLNRTGGIDYKQTNLDASVILAVLHGHTNDGFLAVTDKRLLATAEKLLATFHTLYPINQATGTIGTAIGRYPEDRYGGINFKGGNPWVLLTAALSQYYYKVAQEYLARGSQKDASIAYYKAEDLLRRVQYHAPSDGALAEQMDRNTGFMTSARDLTWSHSEVLEMFAARSATNLLRH